MQAITRDPKVMHGTPVFRGTRRHFGLRDCQTAAYAGLAGLKNGRMLAAAKAAGFDVMITTDQESPFQQDLEVRRIAIVILSAPTNRLSDLWPLVSVAVEAMQSIQPGQAVRVSTTTSSTW